MKSLVRAACAAILLTVLSSGRSEHSPLRNLASEEGPISADEKIIVDFLRPFVRSIDHSVFIYHWSRANPRTNGQNQLLSASDPRAYRYVTRVAPVYYSGWGKADDDSILGPGLYFSSDPVDTRDFGGYAKGAWTLIQLELPAGFSVLDVSTDFQGIIFPPSVSKALTRIGCESIARDGVLAAFVRPTDTHVSAECRLAMRKILDERLAFDAIVYTYGSMNYPQCDWTSHQTAFVLTNSRHVSAGQVRGFNSTTADESVSRRHIQATTSLGRSNEILWPGYKFVPITTDEKWIENHLFGCGSRPALGRVDQADKASGP